MTRVSFAEKIKRKERDTHVRLYLEMEVITRVINMSVN